MTVTIASSSKLPTQWGEFAIYVFEEAETQKEHLALVFGELSTTESNLCRIHSECLTGDALFSLRCDCGPQLQKAMQTIAKQGRGVILYLRQEGRNIGLSNKIKAYALQDKGADTVEANQALGFDADERSYEMCKAMFDYLGVTQLELMTNNPKKVTAMEALGLIINNRVPIIAGENSHNEAYLETKRSKLGHLGK